MSDFHKDRARPDGLQVHCRACRAVIEKLSLARHRQTRRDYMKKIRLRNKLLKWEYLLSRPCVDCGEADPLVPDFDHCEPKCEAIANLLMWQTSWSAIEREMTRCAVRCANCHRKKTARERGWRQVYLPVLQNSRGFRFGAPPKRRPETLQAAVLQSHAAAIGRARQ